MLVEIQYHDHEGSICPFCGNDLSISYILPQKTTREGYSITLYPATCKQGHMVFLVQEFEQRDEYEYTVRVFAFYQDVEEHLEIYIADGPYELDMLDDEDDCWLINREYYYLNNKDIGRTD